MVPVTEVVTRSARMVTPAQTGKVLALYRALGITDRAARLADMGDYLGLTLGSTTEVTFDEAKMLIDYLSGRLPA